MKKINIIMVEEFWYEQKLQSHLDSKMVQISMKKMFEILYGEYNQKDSIFILSKNLLKGKQNIKFLICLIQTNE